MYGGSGVAVAAPDEKLCPRTLSMTSIFLGVPTTMNPLRTVTRSSPS